MTGQSHPFVRVLLPLYDCPLLSLMMQDVIKLFLWSSWSEMARGSE